jgi:3-oxoacyl-[acyl-carrier-protein] synthase II
MAVSIVASGSVSAAGLGRKSLLRSLKNHQIHSIEREFNNKKYPVFAISEDTQDLVDSICSQSKDLQRLDKNVKYTLAATHMMMQEAGSLPRGKGLINIASSRGNTGVFEQTHSDFLKDGKCALLTSPLTTAGNISSEVSSFLAVSHNAIIDSSQTCSSSTQAILNAIAWLESGMADWAIVGGSEAPLTPYTLGQVEALGIYSPLTNEEFPCRPFGKNAQNTFALGEGAAIFLLMRSEDCTHSIASISSWGVSFMHPPSKTGIKEDGGPLVHSMQSAIDKVKGIPDLILAHAPGTLKGDSAELNAVINVFGEKHPPLLSSKYLTGHTYGASSALNAELAIALFNENFLHILPYNSYVPSANIVNPCNILINATGFGGSAASLIVSKVL